MQCESCGGSGFADPRHSDAWCKSCEGRGKSRTGRPVSTGSSSTKPVVYRVTAAQRAELDEEARRLGLSSADLAAKARAFPKLGTEVKR